MNVQAKFHGRHDREPSCNVSLFVVRSLDENKCLSKKIALNKRQTFCKTVVAYACSQLSVTVHYSMVL